jgi:nitrogen fixation/metabolism regulation signal transduction histidine kinase
VALYFASYQIGVWLLVAIERHIWTTVENMFGAETASNLMITLICLVVIVGIMFIYDAVRFTHRVVGPLVRFRRAFEAIRDGEDVAPVQLRKDDLLHELKDEFNQMLHSLESRGAITLKTAETKSPEVSPAEKTVKV